MKVLYFIPFLVFLFGCNAGSEALTASQKDAIQKEASGIIENVFVELAQGSAENRMELCENSEDFSFILPEGVFSWQGLNDYIAADFNKAEKENLETKTDKYIIIDQACFIYVWSGKIEIYYNNGDIYACDDYYSTWTFVKKDGEWKMINGHESSKEPFKLVSPLEEQ